jgi:hypothetical protein
MLQTMTYCFFFLINMSMPYLFYITYWTCVYLKDYMMMSMPDTLPMEIALIALLLFKFQAYSTSLHHYYHRPITLSTFRLLHQPTMHHIASINALRLPLKKFFCLQDWCLTYTQYSLTQPQLPRVQLQQIPSISMSFPELNFTSIAYIKSHETYSWQYFGIINHYEAALRVIAATFIISSIFDSIDGTSMATTATHAIRLRLVRLSHFSCITYKFYCSNVSFMSFLHSSPFLFALFPSKSFYPFLPFLIQFVPPLKFIFTLLFSFNSFRIAH